MPPQRACPGRGQPRRSNGAERPITRNRASASQHTIRAGWAGFMVECHPYLFNRPCAALVRPGAPGIRSGKAPGIPARSRDTRAHGASAPGLPDLEGVVRRESALPRMASAIAAESPSPHTGPGIPSLRQRAASTAISASGIASRGRVLDAPAVGAEGGWLRGPPIRPPGRGHPGARSVSHVTPVTPVRK